MTPMADRLPDCAWGNNHRGSRSLSVIEITDGAGSYVASVADNVILLHAVFEEVMRNISSIFLKVTERYQMLRWHIMRVCSLAVALFPQSATGRRTTCPLGGARAHKPSLPSAVRQAGR